MTSTDARRPAALPCSLRLAIGGALIALMSLNAQAGKTANRAAPLAGYSAGPAVQ